MADVQLEVIDLSTGQTIGTFSLIICTPNAYELDVGSYQFKATYLPTGEVLTQNVSIIEGINPQLDFTFIPTATPPSSTEQPPYPMPLLPEFPTIPDPVLPPATFQYTMDKVGGNYVIKDQAGTTVYSNTDPQKTLQQLITLAGTNNASSYVKNLGMLTMTGVQDVGTGLECMLKFNSLSTPMKIYLESGLSLVNAVPVTYKGLLKFDGRWEATPNTMRNGCVVEGINGRAKVTGQGSTLNEIGVYIRMGSHLQLRHLEIAHIGRQPLAFDADAGGEVPAHNDDNYFEDLYIHGFSIAATDISQAAGGMFVDGSRNVFRTILIDGESLIGARYGINIWAENLEDVDNVFEDIEVRNIQRDGVYLCSDSFAVSLHFFRRILVINAAQQNGYSAVKLRPAYYSYFEDLTIDTTNSAGLTLGTAMTEGAPATLPGNDGLGGPHNGWSRGNRFIRTIIRNCRIAGMNMDIDLDGLGVEQNYVDAYIKSCGMGLWFNNGIEGSSYTGITRDNTFFVTIENCVNRAIDMGANLANGGLTYRNRVTGVIKNCPVVALIRDVGCMDNYFDLVIIGGGTITDNGTRNRWNGVGKYAYGVGVIPPSSDWNNGDIIINTSDNTAWYKSAGTVTKLNVGQAIAQFTYMEGKGGLPAGTAQFIDKSFVSGRTIAGWLWNFGDGTATSTLQHPVHPYGAKGTYNVTLTVTDNFGNKTTTIQPTLVEEQGIVYRTLTIQTVDNGTTNPVAGSYSIVEGQTGIVFATPSVGYIFDHWELDGANVGSDSPIYVLMNSDHVLKAIFVQLTFNLTISTNDPSMGTTSPAPGTYAIPVNTSQQVSSIPSTGYMFGHWELDGINVGSTSPYSVLMDTDHSILAVFAELPPPPPQKQYLTIVAINGQTNPSPATYELDKDSSIIVTATPSQGFKFKHWLFDNVIAGLDPTKTVVMDANHTLVAVCEAVSPTPLTSSMLLPALGLLAVVGISYLATRKKR